MIELILFGLLVGIGVIALFGFAISFIKFIVSK